MKKERFCKAIAEAFTAAYAAPVDEIHVIPDKQTGYSRQIDNGSQRQYRQAYQPPAER